MNSPQDLPRKYADESVLVIPFEALNKILPSVGIWPVSEPLLQLISRPSVMRREDAERTTTVTQLVAYYLVTNGNRILVHRRTRRQPEKRLTAIKAAGFSGHMTTSDLQTLSTRDLFHQGADSGYANRELAEEVAVRISSYEPILLRCCVWEPINDFGKQHLGLVYVVPAEETFQILEPGLLADAEFKSLIEIRNSLAEYTSWSRLLLESEYFCQALAR